MSVCLCASLPRSIAPSASYELSDCEDEEEDENEGGRERGKPVPAWAKGDALEAALRAQFGTGAQITDPDEVFGTDVPECNLEGTIACA